MIARQLKANPCTEDEGYTSNNDSKPSSDDDDVKSDVSQQSAISKVQQKFLKRTEDVIARKEAILGGFRQLLSVKKSLSVEKFAQYLIAWPTSKGLPFIAANGETYVEIFEDTASKTLDPRRTL